MNTQEIKRQDLAQEIILRQVAESIKEKDLKYIDGNWYIEGDEDKPFLLNQELKNFIEHYGLVETLEALSKYLMETETELSKRDKTSIKEFVEQQIDFFSLEI